MTVDEKYMLRCLELAQCGMGAVSPNPMVGAIVVLDDEIIGEGYHREYGSHHAEVNAIAEVKELSLLKRSTLYVSLEPCSHQGKTPACTSLILEKGIPRVKIACLDPFEKVSGQGVRILQEAGVDVEVGILESEAQWLNRRFMTAVMAHRPYIILKWAETADGFIAPQEQTLNEPLWISSMKAKYYVHKMRATEDAILVGAKTASLDNPHLNIRYWSGTNPLRVVLDRDGLLPPKLHIFDDEAPSIIYGKQDSKEEGSNTWVDVRGQTDYLHFLLHDLYLRNIRSLIVEGGRELLQSFLDAGLWDEAHQLQGKVKIQRGLPAPKLPWQVERINHCYLGDTQLSIYKNI